MSSRRKILAGNWKMNLSSPEARKLAAEIIRSGSNTKITKILFPSFPLIPEVISTCRGSDFKVGAQDCSEQEKGAYTGDVSALMLRSLGCEFVLVGHSERRTYQNESNAQLVNKLKRALENELSPVFCFGEKLSDRKAGSHFDTAGIQLHEVLRSFTQQDVRKMILAYEPVWAIGTGETASPEQAQEMHAFVRRTVKEMFDVSIALSIPILYGGSCNAQNAKELFACPDVDGGLIGGASLKAAELSAIIHSF